MKKCFVFAALLAATFGLTGCVGHRFMSGGYTSDIQSVDFAHTRFKVGSSCGTYILGIPFGEARFLDAVQNGRISKVQFHEDRYENYIIFAKNCIDVYGQ